MGRPALLHRGAGGVAHRSISTTVVAPWGTSTHPLLQRGWPLLCSLHKPKHPQRSHRPLSYTSSNREVRPRAPTPHISRGREEDLGSPREGVKRADRRKEPKASEDDLKKACCRTEVGEGVRREHAGDVELPVGVVAPRPHRGREWSAGAFPELPDMPVGTGGERCTMDDGDLLLCRDPDP